MLRTLTALTVAGLLAVTGAAVLAPPAAANAVYAGEHGLDQPEVDTIVAAARAFHAARGVPTEQPVLLTAPHLPEYGSAGEVTPWAGRGEPRCLSFPPSYGHAEVVCRERWLYARLATVRNRYLDRFDRLDAYLELCTSYFHELGHVGGLALPVRIDGRWQDNHPAHGLMSAELTTPGDCYSLARTVIRNRRPKGNTRWATANRRARPTSSSPRTRRAR